MAPFFTATDTLRTQEEQIVMALGWQAFEQEKLANLSAAEESIRIQMELAQNPNRQQHNSYGLQTNQPEPVGLYDVGLTASQ